MIDLDETATILTSQNGESLYLRAIRLFEFQTCLFYPETFAAEKDTAIQKNARLLAVLKLLGYLEARILKATEQDTLSLCDLSKDGDYVEIFDKVFLRSGGWRAIRNIWNAKEFDEQIKIRLGQARTAAKLVDFSYRFATIKPNHRQKAGPTMARSIICSSPSYQYKKELSTLKTRWREYGATAAFSYLLFVQKFELKPPPVSSRRFCPILLTQVADTGHITEFFQAYRHLCDVLGTRGYRFPRISAIESNSALVFPLDPFPTDVEEAIANYGSKRKTSAVDQDQQVRR
jgi:hypothetical protein